MASYQALTISSNAGILRSINTDVTLVVNGLTKIVHAIWDTGATGTCISDKVIQELNLLPLGFTVVNTANGSTNAGQFVVDLLFPNNVMMKDLRVTEFSGTPDVDMLIGMDVICAGDMSITNANQKTVFSYRIPPDWFHIDYVATAKSNKQGKTVKTQIKKIQTK